MASCKINTVLQRYANTQILHDYLRAEEKEKEKSYKPISLQRAQLNKP